MTCSLSPRTCCAIGQLRCGSCKRQALFLVQVKGLSRLAEGGEGRLHVVNCRPCGRAGARLVPGSEALQMEAAGAAVYCAVCLLSQALAQFQSLWCSCACF
jgi:hypothetical protein